MDTIIKKAFTEYENRLGHGFKPDKRFYQTVGINQKRFGQLLRGDKPIYGYEAISLASFLGAPLEDICKNECPNTAGNSFGQGANL